MILPEDVQTVLPAVAAHRLQPTDDHGNSQADVDRVRELFASVALLFWYILRFLLAFSSSD